MTPVTTPASDLDLFDDATLTNPYPTYAQLRDLGPVVYLERHDVWAFTHFDVLREALLDYRTYSSVDGIGLTSDVNKSFSRNVLIQDPPEHAEYRRALIGQLGPRSTHELRPRFDKDADNLVRSMIDRGSVDAARMASEEYVQPLMIDLIGLTDDNRDNVVRWAHSFFNLLGPANERTFQSLSDAMPLFAYLESLPTSGSLRPGSWGGEAVAAAERGEITADVCYGTVGAYIVPSMITTIDGINSAIWLLAQHPEQWRRLRANPDLAANAFAEALRCETPIQLFGRRVTKDTAVGAAAVPEGAQAMMLYGAGNRDEKKWGPTAADFAVERADAADHLAFGHGPHTCLGKRMAEAQGEALLRALATHVKDIELDGEPHWELNNLLRGPSSLPVRLIPA